MHIPLFAKLCAPTLILICLRDAVSFNVGRNNAAIKYLTAAQNQSQAGSQISSTRSSFYGYNLKITNRKELILSSPKSIYPLFGDAETAASGTFGELQKCVIDFQRPDTCRRLSMPMPNQTVFAVDSKNDTIRACAPAAVLECGDTSQLPGFCYESEDNSGEWTFLKAIIPECPKRAQKMDIIFLLDGSGSVRSNFGDIKRWTQNMAAKFDVENGINQIGVVQFSGSSYPRTEIELGSITDNAELKREIGQITHLGGGTSTAAALEQTTRDFESATRWRDPDTKKVLVVLTDGKATDGDYRLVRAAKKLRSKGIIPFAVGVGKFDEAELRTIATGNSSSDERVLSVENYDGLDGIVTKLSDLIFQSALEGGSGNMSVASNELQLSQTGFTIISSLLIVLLPVTPLSTRARNFYPLYEGYTSIDCVWNKASSNATMNISMAMFTVIACWHASFKKGRPFL